MNNDDDNDDDGAWKFDGGGVLKSLSHNSTAACAKALLL